MQSPHSVSTDELIQSLTTDRKLGLTNEEADKRLIQYGRNILREHKEQNPFILFLSQFKNSLTALLFAAAVISFFFKDIPETIAIALVILINACIGFILEFQAHRSMRALRSLEKKFSKVIREGKLKAIESSLVVPGDVLFIEAGDLASADGRIIDATQLEVNQSLLTGESIPVPKNNTIMPEETILAEQQNMFFKGTAATSGNARVLVTGTGMNTQMGEISEMMAGAQKDEIPLNKKLNALSHKLIWLTLVFITVFVGVGYVTGKELYLMIETALALAVAAIPEGLPIVATIALAKGMFKMARHQVLVKKLAAVETLGGTDLILTDKTGTLTENKLEVHRLSFPEINRDFQVSNDSEVVVSEDQLSMKNMLSVASLCNNASLDGSSDGVGDPLETALLRFVLKQDAEFFHSINQWQRYYEKAFDSESRIMVTGHAMGHQYFMAMKGSPVEVMASCATILVHGEKLVFDEEEKNGWTKRVGEMAEEGLKVLGFGYKESKEKIEASEADFTFIGLVAFIDPPRPEVPMAIKKCHEAGIKVVMVTGDHAKTARSIALKVGLTNDQEETVIDGSSLADKDLNEVDEPLKDTIIYSRVNPAQKLALMTYYQQQGNVVAMTGDGVNDAPALKKADIGIAMGLRGTDVAREAADMVLQDDSFSSIAHAIRQGRIIINNIKNFVIYLLSCNLSEILIVGFAAFSNLTLPLLPLQILFLNLVTDVFPALALGMGGGNPGIMHGKFRAANEPIITPKDWRHILGYAMVLTSSVLGIYIYSIEVLMADGVLANNIAFYTLAFAQLTHPLSLIKGSDPLLKNEIVRNLHLWVAIAFCILLMLLAYWVEPLSSVLKVGDFSQTHVLLIALGATLPVLVIGIIKRIRISNK